MGSHHRPKVSQRPTGTPEKTKKRTQDVLATSLLRMPLPTVLAGHLLYSAISFLHPICAFFLLLPCLHKLHVRGQPLGDPVSWGVRFTGSNAAWSQNVNHNHQC